MTEFVLQSVVTCPACGHQATETMPTDACQYFYQCLQCDAVLQPKEGACCVFCSYGTVACPPIQQNDVCCDQPSRALGGGQVEIIEPASG